MSNLVIRKKKSRVLKATFLKSKFKISFGNYILYTLFGFHEDVIKLQEGQLGRTLDTTTRKSGPPLLYILFAHMHICCHFSFADAFV